MNPSATPTAGLRTKPSMSHTSIDGVVPQATRPGAEAIRRHVVPSWRAVGIFLAIAFGLGWLVQVGQALVFGSAAAATVLPAFLLYTGTRQLAPAVGAYVARRWSENGYFADAGLRWPGWGYGAIAWILPSVLSFLALLVALPLYSLNSPVQTEALARIGVSLTLMVPVFAVLAFGEEFGWRSYLLPRLMSLLGPWPGLLAHGAIWGLWHAPIILLLAGYEYPGHPLLGVPLFIVFCTLLGVIFGWLQLASRSVVAPTIAHAAFNLSVLAPRLLLKGADAAVAGFLFSPLGWLVALLVIGILMATGALPRAMRASQQPSLAE
jgi:membrane protease YdiL (CAAX protease family)